MSTRKSGYVAPWKQPYFIRGDRVELLNGLVEGTVRSGGFDERRGEVVYEIETDDGALVVSQVQLKIPLQREDIRKGNLMKNGKGIYSGTAAQEDDYVIYKQGGRYHAGGGRYYIDRIGRGGTHTQIGLAKGCARLSEAREAIRKDAHTRGIKAGIVFEQRGDELAQIGHTDSRHEAAPLTGDRSYTGGKARTARLLKRNSSLGASGIHNDPELLQQLVQSSAESMELDNWKDADVTPEVIRVATEYDKALEWTLDEVVLRYPPKNGASASDLWSAEAPYLVLMTLQGAGVGIWDGSWDEFYDKADIDRVKRTLKNKLGLYADDTGGGKLNDALMNAASETCGDPGYSPNASRRREEPDETAARELSLYIENEYDLVGAPNSQGKAIEKNLLKKIKNGTFNLELSEKAWMYLMETGAKKYCKEYADAREWSKVFNKPTRELVAHEFATTFAEEHGAKSMARNANIEIEEFDAPAHWAPAFINGDLTSFDDEEAAEFEAWCAKHPELLWVVDASEESHVGYFNGLHTDLLTYTCHLKE